MNGTTGTCPRTCKATGAAVAGTGAEQALSIRSPGHGARTARSPACGVETFLAGPNVPRSLQDTDATAISLAISRLHELATLKGREGVELGTAIRPGFRGGASLTSVEPLIHVARRLERPARG